MPADTSRDLLRKLNRDPSSQPWSEFLATYVPFIERQLRRMGLNEFDAADVRQNVLAKLIRELPNFQHNGHSGAFRLWLRTLVRNQLRSFRRKHRDVGCDVSALESVSMSTEDDSAWEQEFAAYVVERALQTLESRFDGPTMQAFRRQFLEEADPAIVACELSKTKQAVIAAKCRVLRALRIEVTRLNELESYVG